MSRREFVSRFYRSEDDYTKQIENSLKGGDSYLNLSDEISFDSQNNNTVHTKVPSHIYHDKGFLPTFSAREKDNRHISNVERSQSDETPVVSIESPGYTQTSFKHQMPKQRGCGISYALRRLTNKLICRSKKESLDQTFAYDPYKSLTPNSALS